jgi:serine/threonine protein kinase
MKYSCKTVDADEFECL